MATSNNSSAFVWGRGGVAMTPAEIARRREIENAILAQGVETGPVGHWLEGLARIGNAAAGAFRRGQLDDAEQEGRTLGSEAFNKILSAFNVQQGGSAGTSGIPMSDAGAEVTSTSPSSGQPIDMTGNEVYSGFIDTVKNAGLTNPYGLAAVAATGKAESGWSPENVNRRWSDPSESGVAGTSGAIMSWRGDRLRSLENFAAERGEDPKNISPQTQAAFFLQEDPGLIEKLNSAKSVEEAQSLMNNAWKFAGYNRPGGEAANRLGYATSYLPTFQGQGEVASLDPTAGMPGGAIVPDAEPIAGASLADEVAEFEQTPEYAAQYAATTGQPMEDEQFDSRFGDTALPVEQKAGRAALAQALAEQQRANGGQQAIADQTAGIPVTGQAGQAGGVMQAVNGTNVGGAFGLNPMQERSAQQYAQANLLQDPAFLEALNNPYLSEQQRAIAQTLVEQQMKQQAAEREIRAKQADPSYQLGLKKTRLEIENMENPRETPADKLARERFDYERGTADRTADVKNYEYYAAQERAAGREPLGMLDWDTAQRKAGATSVNVGEGDKFYENLDRKNAETFAAMSDSGIQARGRMAQINRLEALFANVPQGIEGGFKKLAGDYGIAIGEGTSDIQAASALLEKMVPEQRPPGSGPMSDADIAMFRSSLPRILNQPGGNELIFGTMRGIAQYEAEMGVIADRVADRDITPAEGRRMIRELKNPLEDFKIPDGTTPNQGTKTRTGRTWRRVE